MCITENIDEYTDHCGFFWIRFECMRMGFTIFSRHKSNVKRLKVYITQKYQSLKIDRNHNITSL